MNGFLDEVDDTIHAPRRLAICAFLATVDSADFSTVKDALGISDSSLSKQLSTLVEAGYVTTKKIADTGRAHTWIRLTAEGRSAFRTYVKTLRRLLESHPETDDD